VTKEVQSEGPFDPRWDFERWAGGPPRLYLIASTQRSGSYLLSYLLRGTGRLGAPFEYLHPGHEPKWHARLGTDDLESTIQKLFELRTSPNGWFGIKAHWDHWAYGQGEVPGLLSFEKVIRIERRDRLAQAISLALARQTQSWMSIQGKAAEPRYDEREIAHALAILDRDTRAWDEWFRAANVEPLLVYYEDLVSAPLASLNAILAHFDMQPVTSVPAVPTSKQGSELNDVWKRRYSSATARWKRRAKASLRRLLRL